MKRVLRHLAWVAVLWASAAHGQEGESWSLGVLAGKGMKSNLLDAAPRLVAGNLHLERDYLSGLLIRRNLQSPQWLEAAGNQWGLPLAVSAEGGLFDHRGLSDVTEATFVLRLAADAVRSERWKVGLAFGAGFSYAFDTPTYDGAGLSDRTQLRRLLFHMTPELQFAHRAFPGWTLGLRVHHRSGVYGIVAPPRVGSNHAAWVLMWTPGAQR